MLSEINQRKIYPECYLSHVEYEKKTKNKYNKTKRLIDKENKLVDTSRKRKGRWARQGYWLRKYKLLCIR